jgi:hypothetical protein
MIGTFASVLLFINAVILVHVVIYKEHPVFKVRDKIEPRFAIPHIQKTEIYVFISDYNCNGDNHVLLFCVYLVRKSFGQQMYLPNVGI